MALLGKIAATLGCAATALALPMLATANEGAEVIEATHFVSSGRVVNLVAGVTPDQQDEARAALWALTQHVDVPTCADTAAADASCFEAFHAGAQ